MTTWLDYAFIRDEEGAREPRIVVGERTGWEAVIFAVSEDESGFDDRPLRDALASLDDAIRSAEHLVAEVLSDS